MSDTSTSWNVALVAGDWQIASLQLVAGGDLQTAVLISLFTDRVADADDIIPDGTTNRRGWWGDAGETVPIGSRLWLLDRSLLTPATANRAVDYAYEALQWLLDDGVAANVQISAQIMPPKTLGLWVVVTKVDGTKVPMNFDWVWNGVG